MDLEQLSIVINARIDGFEAGMAQAERGLGRLATGAKATGETLTKFVTLPLGLLAVAAVKTAGDLQALETGFKAVYKGASDVGEEIKKTLEVAKLPGLGLKEALQGSTNLQAAGFSAEEARKSLMAFGNALATVGRGKAELDRVILALTQISNTTRVSQQDLNQLKQVLPQIGGIMKQSFGTTNADGLRKLGISSQEFVKSLTSEFSKLPQVTGGVKNSLENLSDAGTLALAKLGESANNALGLQGMADKLAASVTGLAEGFAAMSPEAQKTILALAGIAASAGPVLLAVGSIGKAVPVAVEGFTLLRGAGVALATSLGPVGLAVAAVSAALLYYVATSKSALEQFNETSKKASDISSALEPLLAKYEELTKKTKLTSDEQVLLKETIVKIGEVTPSAITAVDAYGNAMSISTTKAREYAKALQDIAKVDAAKALPAEAAKLKDFNLRLAQSRKELADFNKGQVKTVPVFNSQGQQVGQRSSVRTPDEVLELKKRTAELVKAQVEQLNQVNTLRKTIGLTPIVDKTDLEAARLAALKQEEARIAAAAEANKKIFDSRKELEGKIAALEELNDNNNTNKGQIAANNILIAQYKAQIKALDELGVGSKKSSKDGEALVRAQEEFTAGLKKANLEFKLQGDAFDVAGEKAKVYKRYLDSLIDLKQPTNSKAFQAASDEFQRLTALSKEFQDNASFRQIFLDAELAIKADEAAVVALGKSTSEAAEQAKILEKQLTTSLNAIEAMRKKGAEDDNAFLAAEIEHAQELTAELEKARENKRALARADASDDLLDNLNGPQRQPSGILSKVLPGAEDSFGDLYSGKAQEALMKRIQESRKAIKELEEEGASAGIIKSAEDALDSLKGRLDLTDVYAGAAQQAGDSLAEIGSVIVEGIGGIITGQMSVTDGLRTIFSKTLSIVGQFMKDFGKQLLLLGAGHVAMGLATANPAMVTAGALELAAGGALTLAGSLVSMGGAAAMPKNTPQKPTVTAAATPTPSRASQQQDRLQVEIKMAPVELYANGKDLRGVLQLDSYHQRRYD